MPAKRKLCRRCKCWITALDLTSRTAISHQRIHQRYDVGCLIAMGWAKPRLYSGGPRWHSHWGAPRLCATAHSSTYYHADAAAIAEYGTVDYNQLDGSRPGYPDAIRTVQCTKIQHEIFEVVKSCKMVFRVLWIHYLARSEEQTTK